MNSVASSYEDTLRSMRTSKSEASPLTSLKRYMTWGRNSDVLPYSTKDGGAGGAAQEGAFLSWPPWAATTASPTATPFYETFGLTLMQRYTAFGLCTLGAALLFLLVRRQSWQPC